MNIDSCPGSWQCKSVIDLISDIGERKGSVQRQMYNKEGKYPIVDQGSGLVGGYTDDEFLVYKKDLPIILFGDHTRNFKYLDFPFAAGADGTKLFRANEELCNPKFLYFALLHLDIPSRGYNRHFRMLRNQTIAFPKSINEQRAIAFVLSKIQAAAETQDRIIARLKELKAATMVKLFREGTRGEKLKMTEIGEMPESWKMISMGDVVEIKQGQVDPKKDPYASMIHIGPENIEVETGRLLPCSTAREQGLISGKYLFIKGDIVYSKIRPYLKKAIIAPSEGICSADVYPLTVKEGYNSLFIHGVILSELFTRQAAAQQGRTGIPKLNREQLNSILISAPSLEEQFIIGNILRMMDLRLENAIGIYCNMSSLFSSMLHLLLTARLRLPAEIIAAAGAGAPEPRREAPPPKDWAPAEALRLFVADLVRKFNPEKVVLFGSRAAGTARPDSDADLLVVMDYPGRRLDAAARLYAEVKPALPVDFVLRRPEELRRRVEWGDPFLKDITEKGKVLYERTG